MESRKRKESYYVYSTKIPSEQSVRDVRRRNDIRRSCVVGGICYVLNKLRNPFGFE